MAKLIYPKLSYTIVGILYKVHSNLGGNYQEKYYQRAVAIELKELGLSFTREIAVELSYQDEKVGRYLLDFLIEDKIILELKAKPLITHEDFRRVKAYP
jgi:GxxExxY protein